MPAFYVDASSGSDVNDGLTASTALKTITAAEVLCIDGDSVYCKGVFDELVSSAKSLSFFADVFAVIDRQSAGGSKGFVLTGDTVSVVGFVVRNCALSGIDTTFTDSAVITGCEIVNCGSTVSDGGIKLTASGLSSSGAISDSMTWDCAGSGMLLGGSGTYTINHCTSFRNLKGYYLKNTATLTIRNSIGDSNIDEQVNVDSGVVAQYKIGCDFNNWFGTTVSNFGADLAAHKAALSGRDKHSKSASSTFVNTAVDKAALELGSASTLVGAAVDGRSIGAREIGFQIVPSGSWTLDPELTFTGGIDEIDLNVGETVGIARSPVIDLGAEYTINFVDLVAIESFYASYIDTFLPGPYAPPDLATIEIRGDTVDFPAADPMFGYPDYVDMERRDNPALLARYVQVRLTFRRP